MSKSLQERPRRLARRYNPHHTPALCPGRPLLQRPNILVNGVSDTDGAPFRALLMLVLLEGKDRSLTEFLNLSALGRLEVTATQTQDRFLIECRPIPAT